MARVAAKSALGLVYLFLDQFTVYFLDLLFSLCQGAVRCGELLLALLQGRVLVAQFRVGVTQIRVGAAEPGVAVDEDGREASHGQDEQSEQRQPRQAAASPSGRFVPAARWCGHAPATTAETSQILGQFQGRGVRRFGSCGRHCRQIVCRSWHRGLQLTRGNRFRRADQVECLPDRGRLEGRTTGQALIEDRAQGPQMSAAGPMSLWPRALFGGHVARRTYDGVVLGCPEHRDRGTWPARSRRPWHRNQRPALHAADRSRRYQSPSGSAGDVGRLEVAVDQFIP